MRLFGNPMSSMSPPHKQKNWVLLGDLVKNRFNNNSAYYQFKVNLLIKAAQAHNSTCYECKQVLHFGCFRLIRPSESYSLYDKHWLFIAMPKDKREREIAESKLVCMNCLAEAYWKPIGHKVRKKS